MDTTTVKISGWMWMLILIPKGLVVVAGFVLVAFYMKAGDEPSM